MALAMPRPAKFAAPLRCLTAASEAIRVCELQDEVEVLLEFTAVIVRTKGALIRKRSGWKHVHASQLDSIDAQLPRRIVNEALDQVDGFGPAGTAIGCGRICI